MHAVICHPFGEGDMNRPTKCFPRLPLALVLALAVVVGLGCGEATVPGGADSQATAASEQNGAQPGSTTATTGGEWVPIDQAPAFAGVEAVPARYAVRVESTSSNGTVGRSLVVPATGSFRLELITDAGPTAASCDVVVNGVHYGFIPGDGVVESRAPGAGPRLDQAYGTTGLNLIPADAAWSKRGDSYRAAFTYKGGEGGAEIAVEMTYEAEQDPATGILLREWLSHPDGTEETRRELVPLPDVEVPTADTIYEYAAESWSQAVEALRQLPYEAVGLDLPGLVASTILVFPSDTGSRYATIGYSLASSPTPHPSVAQIDLFPYGPDTPPLASDPAEGYVAFRRGDAMVRVGVPGWPEMPAGLDLSLDTLTAALVPIAQLSDDHFPLPVSYTPAGATKLQ
jgi:hypothetical protein